MARAWVIRTASLLAVCAVLAAARADAAGVPLKIDWPPGAAGGIAIPVAGGVPFAKGQVPSADNIRLVDGNKKEIPCQVSRLAVWPDGSVKWALVDAVLAPAAGETLSLEFGADVRRAPVTGALTAALNGPDARISGGGVTAAIRKTGGGVVDELAIGGKSIIAPAQPARLVIETLRAGGPDALPVNRFVCRDPNAALDAGKVQVDELAVESPGPIRATVLVRGHVLLPHFGATLPDEVKRVEPPGRMPFSMRLSFFKDCSVVYGQHQIVFSGEPDCDYIARWGVELPGLAGPRGTLVLEPGVELEQVGAKLSVARETRLCWAPLKGGLALIRQGWQNRPCAITQEHGSAWVDFWPQAAGVWDLRRYAREWAVGESGDTKDAASIERFARYAARGLAKSHSFVLWFGETNKDAALQEAAVALQGRALLRTPPAWYAGTNALGPFAPLQTDGEFAAVDKDTERRVHYHLYCQDLFGWYGKTTYGFWQSRYGQVHRNDRWDNDYGRWGWALNDGAGRIGHVLMLECLRMFDRRVFDAGEAFNRINYDTNMVHTAQHLENTKTWWTVKGCSHRHNVQPFGCPYIGMRGSYPGGQRILYLLTGDGVIADGLDIVADAAFQYASGKGSRLGNSGESDGQGSAASALLWKYETTGDKKYLDACRTVLDKTGLIPPKSAKELAYGPSFGVFNAAGEYAELSDDKAFQERVVAVARMGAKEKEPEQFLYAMALGYRFSKDETLRAQLETILRKRAATPKNSLEDLPPEQWPGHAGWRTPSFDANTIRDLPYAMGALVAPPSKFGWEAEGSGGWRRIVPKAIPSPPSPNWFKPGGEQAAGERVGKPRGEGREGLSLPNGKATAFCELIVPKAGTALLVAERTVVISDAAAAGQQAELLVFSEPAQVEGVAAVRVTGTCKVTKGKGRVASWGLLVPLKLSGNGNLIQTTAPGRFRLERCRLDQNDERIPNWLTSEYNWGEGAALWPKWRESGIQVGPGNYYRIWRANRGDVSPVFCDQGEGPGNWLDITDRGASPRWGLTARVLRPSPPAPLPQGES
ncbi:MAG: hypothetical protein NTW87_37325, partial [Planctomycetota bacterium]|nr:hypothetical protein [Planctomycetota bacterium]